MRVGVGVIAYTARGHGDSRGWEINAQEFQQFTWENLADDMIGIGDREDDRFLRRSLISSDLRLFRKAEILSSGLLRLFRISSRVGRRAKTPNCHFGVTLMP
jgi:flagellar biosynthesis regulator FlaF